MAKWKLSMGIENFEEIRREDLLYRQDGVAPRSAEYLGQDETVHAPADGAPAFELETHTLSPARVPSIPLGALVARDFSHLLIAGRCISGDRMAQSAYRVQATCMGMGHAAGVAAAVRLASPGDMRAVDAQTVRQALRAQKAVVPE